MGYELIRKCKLLLLYPFAPTLESAGFSLEVAPLSKALQSVGCTLEVYWTSARGTLESAVAYARDSGGSYRSPFGGLAKVSELQEAASLFVYESLGRLVPPLFHLRDVKTAISNIDGIAMNYDAVISFKPWFRTVLPTMRISRKCHAISVLWMDDFDIAPRSPCLRWFDCVVVNSRTLAERYALLNPLLLRHTVESSLLSARSASAANAESKSVIILFPGTGYPRQDAAHIIQEVIDSGASEIRVINGTRVFGRERSQAKFSQGCSVSLFEKLPREQVLRMLDSSAIAVIPQTENAYGDSKTSGRLLEAMARGLASVVPERGETSRLVTEADCGRKYSLTRPGSLSRELRSLMFQPEEVSERGQRALQSARRFPSWEEHAESLVRFISDRRHCGM